MIDPLISLAYSIQSNRGVYSLLVGSGVSRSAAIPTGWEVSLDLVRKLSHLEGEGDPPDPADWYRTKYGNDPDYSLLLNSLAKSPVERRALLAAYFEPSEDDRESGLRQPTAAHRSIARLVVGGFLKVIITTNFDRLLERAIEDEGLVPTVLSTVDAVEGSVPLIHQRCVIVKLHGDYLDPRIKNTADELSQYDPSVVELLDRILDEFGLIICGWSGQWDPALVSAIARCKSRRFTTYWASRGPLSGQPLRLLEARDGVVVSIQDADTFFTDLAEKVIALNDLQRPHPLSIATASATVKRHLADDRQLIRYHDLLQIETETAYCAVEPILASVQDNESFAHAVSVVQSRLEVLRAIAVHSAYWAKAIHLKSLVASITRLASDPNVGRSGHQVVESVRILPAVQFLYSAGLGALANDNIECLVALLTRPILSKYDGKYPLLTSFSWPDFQKLFKALPQFQNRFFPASDWLFEDCRLVLREIVPSDTDYDRLFDHFEFIRSLVHVDMECRGKYEDEDTVNRAWGPPGRFVWNSSNGRGGRDTARDVSSNQELTSRMAACGLFDGNSDNVTIALTRFSSLVQRFAQSCW